MCSPLGRGSLKDIAHCEECASDVCLERSLLGEPLQESLT
jgi:hypothetical protein